MTSFHIGPAIETRDVSLRVVEITSVEHHRMERGIFLQAQKEPYAVLVRKAGVTYAIGMDGARMSTSHLVEKIPEVPPSSGPPLW